jgi:hypothetical protein
VIWLSNAWEVFGAPEHVERAYQAAELFAELRMGETPEMHLRSIEQTKAPGPAGRRNWKSDFAMAERRS